jgi:hypothetical protein
MPTEGQRSQSKVRSTFAHSFLAYALVFTYFFYVFTNFFPWSFCCVSASAHWQFTCDSRSCASAPVARRRSNFQHLKCSCGIAPTPTQLRHQQRSPNRRFTDTSGTRRACTRIQLACFSPRVQVVGLSITWRCRLSFRYSFSHKACIPALTDSAMHMLCFNQSFFLGEHAQVIQDVILKMVDKQYGLRVLFYKY